MTKRPWLLALVLAGKALAGPYTDQVNPLIGTDGTGHVFPGASAPWGMVAPGPDMAGGGWDYTSGYQYQGHTLLGFSNTHISGAGIPELGDVLLLPAAASAWPAGPQDAAAAYDKLSERARPGYYAVRLPTLGVLVELTATPRVAVHRWTFDRPGRVKVLVDLDHGLVYGDGPRVRASRSHVDAAAGEVAGEQTLHGWVDRQLAFVVHFDHPVIAQATLAPKTAGSGPRYVLEFDLGPSAVLEARVALSTVDEAGARGNLASARALDFDHVRAQTDNAWEALLNRVQIDADARTRRIFYSALYRVLLHPADIADADGRVRGPRGEVMAAPQGRYDSTLSLWDTFRALHPLYTLLWPERVDGFVRTFLAHQRQQGYLPLWTAWGRETHTMIGNPALPVIADAIAKGFGGFDRAEALQAMVDSSTRERPDAPAWAQRDWSTYERLGYLPFDLEPSESISRTVEYGIGDDAVARTARALGQAELAQRFARRAQGWRLVFDPATQTVRGRDSTGHWRSPFDPLEVTSPLGHPGDYTEGNAWQYTATPALFDPLGFREALGGPDALEKWLDTFFALPMPHVDREQGQEALIGQYAHGNEPSHHIAWLYEYTNAPQKSDAMLARITREFYADGPGGIIGNDDCGQMSAWLVLAMLGIYPVEPASATYVAAVPQVARARIALPGGRTLVIERSTTAGTRWQGNDIARTGIPHALLVGGGTLSLGPARALPPQPLPAVTTGHIERMENFASKNIGSRTVDVWLPEGYDPAHRYNVLYMHDGQMLFDAAITWNHQAWNVDATLGRLIREGRVAPTIVVGVFNDPKLRHAEFFPQKFLPLVPQKERDEFVEKALYGAPRSDAYLRFLVEELKPAIDARYATRPGPEGTFLMGSSMGGVISLYALNEYPGVFGGAACLSTAWPSLFTQNASFPLAAFNYLQTHLAPPAGHRLYMDHGSLDLDAQYGPHQAFFDILAREHGYTDANFDSRVFADGHNEKAWAARLEIPLRFLLGRQ